MPTAVWSPGKPLPMSCSSAPTRSRSGRSTVPVRLGGQRGRLQQVPVDGVGVVGVALGLVAHGGPLGDEPHQQAVLVERLDLVDGGPAEAEQRDERLAGSRAATGRPGGGMRSASRCSEPLAMGRSSSAAVAARRSGSDASSETGAGGVSAISPSTSTMSGPRSARPSARARRGAPRRKRRFGGGRGVPEPAPAPDVVAHPGDLAAGRRDGEHERRRRRGSRARRPPDPGPAGAACRARVRPCGAARPGRW